MMPRVALSPMPLDRLSSHHPDMKMIPACALGVPLLIGSAVLARAAFVPDGMVPSAVVLVKAQAHVAHPGAIQDRCAHAAQAVHAEAETPGLQHPESARCLAPAAP